MNDAVRHALVEVRQYARDRRTAVSGSSSEKGVAHELDLLVAFVNGLLVRHRNDQGCACDRFDNSVLPADGERLEFGRHRIAAPDAETAPAWPPLPGDAP